MQHVFKQVRISTFTSDTRSRRERSTNAPH